MNAILFGNATCGVAPRLLPVLHNLVEPFAVDVGVELAPEREVVGELIGEIFASGGTP